MKKEDLKAGENLYALIKKHHIEQSDIEKDLDIDKALISKYVNGRLPISPKNLKKLSQYFDVSPESILYGDLTKVEDDLTEPDEFIKNCDTLLPVFEQKESENTHFAKANQEHRHLFNILKTLNFEIQDLNIDTIMGEYKLAKEDEKSKHASIANYLSLAFLKLLLMKGIAIQALDYSDLPLRMKQYTNLTLDEHLNLQKNLEETAKKYRNAVDSEEFLLDLIECLDELKNDPEWSTLADYYIGLGIIANIFRNTFTDQQNKEFGILLLWIFSIFGNSYADNYINIMVAE